MRDFLRVFVLYNGFKFTMGYDCGISIEDGRFQQDVLDDVPCDIPWVQRFIGVVNMPADFLGAAASDDFVQ